MAAICGNLRCRAYQLTVYEFERLGGQTWTQSLRVRLGLRADKLYVRIHGGKKPKKVRSSTMPGGRSKVGKYPCGILEQAYEIERHRPDGPGAITPNYIKAENERYAAEHSTSVRELLQHRTLKRRRRSY